MGRASILGLQLVLGWFCQNHEHKLSYHQHDALPWSFDYAETVSEVSVVGLSELL